MIVGGQLAFYKQVVFAQRVFQGAIFPYALTVGRQRIFLP